MGLYKQPLHIHITTLFLILISSFGLLLASVTYFAMQKMLTESAAVTTASIASQAVSQVEKLSSPARLSVAVLGHSRIAKTGSHAERMAFLPVLAETLAQGGDLAAVYIGFETGDFFMLRDVGSQQPDTAGYPGQTRFVVQSIDYDAGSVEARYVYLDATLEVIRTEDKPDYAEAYQVVTRPWFIDSITSFGIVTSPPYVFYATGDVGMSITQRTDGGEGVVGVDITLAALSRRLDARAITPSSELVLSNRWGEVIAIGGGALPAITTGNQQLPRLDALGLPAFEKAYAVLQDNAGLDSLNWAEPVGPENWLVSVNRIGFRDAAPLYLSIATPESELLADAIALRNRSLVLTVALLVLAAPLTFLLARSISRSLASLMAEADDIRRFNFSGPPVATDSNITEVHELAITMDRMKSAISRFMDISRAVAQEERFEVLLPMLLRETASAADADRGILYLADREQLVPAAALAAGESEDAAGLPTIDASDSYPLLQQALASGEPAHGVIAAPPGWLPAGWVTAGQALIVQPLRNRRGERVGLLLLQRTDDIDDAQLAFASALASSASSSLETRELIAAQKELFEAFIKMIASAIDAKSAYTGGHCERVPELTKMLARAACDATDGELAAFQLSDADWEAVHVASWLHDCGKVTTPEYVVDKATKLETIYDRIHEVRMRFEVMKAEARIRCLERRLAGDDAGEAEAELATALAALDEDFAFVAECNVGGEFMAPERVERLNAIARRCWTRTLSDRIGISHEELARKQSLPEPALPVQEPALRDTPDQLFPRSGSDLMPEDNPWGFRMDVPEALYNRGELYNLSIPRGTLTNEDRYKINEHIVQTIIMLTTLPFPKHLKEVPEIAGGHHEKMDGTGYPKRLSREDMSPVARMMAIADIFEALTAIDRPYKKGKKLSEALGIMAAMCRDQHIDPDLFALFLRAGVYREYADKYLQPFQVDEVDPADYLPGSAAA